MRYNKNAFSLILAFFLLFAVQKAAAQGPDSIYIVPKTPFITQLLEFKELNASIKLNEGTRQIPVHDLVVDGNAQILIKQGNDIYVFIEQTGFVYQMLRYDTINIVYKRMDKTVNLNYNIDCLNFIYENNLYSYGGYGFWKNNGILRKFNKTDREWDVIPLNQEVISTSYLWVAPQEGRLYLPFQRFINAGIKGPENVKGVPDYTSYYLDFKKQTWVKLGELEQDVIDIVENDYSSAGYIGYQNGYLHRVNEETYLFDIVHNKLFKSKNPNLNQFLIRKANGKNMFILGDKIYSYDETTQTFITIPFLLSDFEILRTGIWGSSNQLYHIMGFVLIIAIIIYFSIWIFKRTVKRKIQVAQLKILKSKTVNQAFTGTETALLILLIATSQKQAYVEINEINHVLGIKDKNIGLQKKVRSDVMKAINEKYEFITQSNVPVIGSARKEEDKRFFEYFITASELNTITRIIENN